MRFVIAPDKFKDSLTGFQFCNAVEEGIQMVLPDADIIKLPLADGGDGTIDVVNYYLKGDKVFTKVNNPIFKKIKASYLYSKRLETAFIEMAEASGIKLLNITDRNCLYTTTLGTGELILDAINKGAKHIILGIGGSATNDCGIGMASALGYSFLDEKGKELKPIGENLSKIKRIDDSNVIPKLKEVSFKIACDVTNPLYGENGAAYVYASQKGASKDEIVVLDKGLRSFSKIIDNHFNIESQSIKGGGAAGGLGIGSLIFFNGQLTSGIELIKEIANFDQNIKNTDWIITGEGQIDAQTLSGKTIQGVIQSAKKQNIPVAAFCGSVDLTINTQKTLGLDYVCSVLKKISSLEEALHDGYQNLVFSVYNFTKLLK
ncbi:glycerate kinase [Tenacibaculum adriaticum]|uniref:Glycerate kinase n=1 Tax=Tenacibaculum adriaticum TaxID=413713 RepID=A0A5S5DWU1_9FLAO|nr:glycerate kinase [Tenacibaculum adriaticum]TYP99089.1 glycerate kinase [Tenacibaculum adriaticum]